MATVVLDKIRDTILSGGRPRSPRWPRVGRWSPGDRNTCDVCGIAGHCAHSVGAASLDKEFCRRIGWYKADGGCKDMMARVVMLAMHRDGRIELPPPKWRQNRPAPITLGPDTEPPLLLPPTTLDAVRPLEMRTVVRGDRGGKPWNEYVARYHYLGYKTLVGAQMRYAVHASDGTPLAMLGFSTAACTIAPRDRFIGWSRRHREKNLPLVVDNPRFLILP